MLCLLMTSMTHGFIHKRESEIRFENEQIGGHRARVEEVENRHMDHVCRFPASGALVVATEQGLLEEVLDVCRQSGVRALPNDFA